MSRPMPDPATYSTTYSGVRLIDGKVFEPPQAVRAFFREAVPGGEDLSELVAVELYDGDGRLYTVPAHAVLYLFDAAGAP